MGNLKSAKSALLFYSNRAFFKGEGVLAFYTLLLNISVKKTAYLEDHETFYTKKEVHLLGEGVRLLSFFSSPAGNTFTRDGTHDF